MDSKGLGVLDPERAFAGTGKEGGGEAGESEEEGMKDGIELGLEIEIELVLDPVGLGVAGLERNGLCVAVAGAFAVGEVSVGVGSIAACRELE